jgi:cation transport ATPase
LKFFIALALTLPVAALAMGAHLVPSLHDTLNQPWRVWAEMLLTVPVLFWAGREFYAGAWASAKHRAADMNTLVAIGTLSAFLYSVVATVAPQLFHTVATHSSTQMKMSGTAGVYYEVAAIHRDADSDGALARSAGAQSDERRDSCAHGFADRKRRVWSVMGRSATSLWKKCA